MQELEVEEVVNVSGGIGEDLAVGLVVAWIGFGYNLGKDLAARTSLQCK